MNQLEALTSLLAVSRGEQPADLVLGGGQVVNLFDGRLEQVDVALHQGLVAGLGSYQGRERVELEGRYLAPGFIEGHLHVESTLLSPARLAQAIAPRGTSLVVADPHEIANVMGLAGVRAMLEGSAGLPVTFLFMAPSCVPATHLETSGARLEVEDLKEMAAWPRILGLAEMMNFPGALNGDPQVLDKLLAFAGRPIDGHAPLLSGPGLNAYVAAGPDSEHECTRLAEAREKLARGMWIMIRQGTSAHNLRELLPLVTPLTERRCLLVSDDRHPDDLAHQGHLDDLLRRAVGEGLDAISALRLVTLNPARRFGLTRRGAVAPGYVADLVVLEDMRHFRVHEVYQAGRLVAREGELLEPLADSFPAQARGRVHLPPLSPQSLTTPVAGRMARVIELVPGQILTRAALEEPPQTQGMLAADPERDLALLYVIERHGHTGAVGRGLLRGLGLREGALASSVAHDSHNLVLAGCDSQSLLTAAQAVARAGGGLCVARGSEVLNLLPLPLAGLMSDRDLTGVLQGLASLRRAARAICRNPEPWMALSFVSLPVIPELKLTDQGLVDATTFSRVELFLS